MRFVATALIPPSVSARRDPPPSSAGRARSAGDESLATKRAARTLAPAAAVITTPAPSPVRSAPASAGPAIIPAPSTTVPAMFVAISSSGVRARSGRSAHSAGLASAEAPDDRAASVKTTATGDPASTAEAVAASVNPRKR